MSERNLFDEPPLRTGGGPRPEPRLVPGIAVTKLDALSGAERMPESGLLNEIISRALPDQMPTHVARRVVGKLLRIAAAHVDEQNDMGKFRAHELLDKAVLYAEAAQFTEAQIEQLRQAVDGLDKYQNGRIMLSKLTLVYIPD